MIFGHKPIDWDAAMVATTRHLKTVQTAIDAFAFTHPEWFVEASAVNYPPRVWIRCFLHARGESHRPAQNVSTGEGWRNPGYRLAFTPTDAELRTIGDFVGALETPDFAPRRVRDVDSPWVEYELRLDFGKYEVEV